MSTSSPPLTPTDAAAALNLPAPGETVLNEVTDAIGGYSSAVLSTCGTYRYALTRIWNPARPIARWIMLNPSTADHTTDDATLRRVRAFTNRAGCGGLLIVNAFALRSTHPRVLNTHHDPVGPYNDAFILAAGRDAAGPVIAAWGAMGTTHDRAAALTALLVGTKLTCYGTTSDTSGYQPRHPLYVRDDTPLRTYTPGQPS